MKKVFMTLVIFVSLTALAFAAGGKNHGSKGKGNTDGTGKGKINQNSRK